MSMVLPGVVGFKLSGKLRNGVTATDLVLTVTQILRKHGVVGKFVEFYGNQDLLHFLLIIRLCRSIYLVSWFLCSRQWYGWIIVGCRATIANMSPEYGATMGFFPIDHVTLQYLKLTGRSDETVSTRSLLFLNGAKCLNDYLTFIFGQM